jgi:uncharacterized protein
VLAVDTNVLVYGADADSRFHNRLPRLARAPTSATRCTWAILYEFRRVTTHARVMRRPWSASAAWNFVAALLASPGVAVLVPTGRHADVAEGGHFGAAASCRQSAPRRAHRHSYAILMREHGIGQICTRDTDFINSRSSK